MNEFKLNFTGIGVAKAGTTWLGRCLSEHPQVCFALTKEPNFFLLNNIMSSFPVSKRFYTSSHYELGLEWYKQQFTHHQPGQLYGEFTNTYIADPESARLLHEHNPKVKVLCCLRNPVEVLYTGFYQLSRAQPLPDTLEETLVKYPHMVRYGLYHTNLQPFLKRFPRAQLHILLFDDLRRDPDAAYAGICRFLGIDDTFKPPSLHVKVNERTVLRSKTIRNLRCRLSALSTATPLLQRVRRAVFRGPLGKWLLKLVRLNEKPGQTPPLTPEEYTRLVAPYRADILKLGELLGRDLSAWLSPPVAKPAR